MWKLNSTYVKTSRRTKYLKQSKGVWQIQKNLLIVKYYLLREDEALALSLPNLDIFLIHPNFLISWVLSYLVTREVTRIQGMLFILDIKNHFTCGDSNLSKMLQCFKILSSWLLSGPKAISIKFPEGLYLALKQHLAR